MTMVHRDVRFDEEKVMQVSLGRELELHAVEEFLSPKIEEPKIYVEYSHVHD